MREVPIKHIGVRHQLFMGGDRELVMMAGLIAFTCVVIGQDLRAAVFGILLWAAALYCCRVMAKADPKLRDIYLRHLIYRKYYPARSTSFRSNSRLQHRQYRDV